MNPELVAGPAVAMSPNIDSCLYAEVEIKDGINPPIKESNTVVLFLFYVQNGAPQVVPVSLSTSTGKLIIGATKLVRDENRKG